MAISSKNTRTMLTLPKELKKQLEIEAKSDGRSFNNYLLKIINERNKSKED